MLKQSNKQTKQNKNKIKSIKHYLQKGASL